MVNYEFDAVVIRVVDADTFDMKLDLGFGLTKTDRYRIKDYDAPETWRPINEAERTHGKEATKFAEELVIGQPIVVRTYKLNKIGAYGRYEAEVILSDGRDYATLMKENGFEKLTEY